MSIGTRVELCGKRFVKFVEGCGGLTKTTFDVFRRLPVGDGARDPRGIQVRPTKQDFQLVGSGQGSFTSAHEHWGVNEWRVRSEGQFEDEALDIFTSFDLRRGDNVVLAATGLTYLVDAERRLGPIRWCRLASQKAQKQHR